MTNETLDLFRENRFQNISGVGPQQAGAVQNGFKHKLYLEDEKLSKLYLTLDGRKSMKTLFPVLPSTVSNPQFRKAFHCI